MMLKEQLTVVLRENAVLKRAVAIQHERQKEFDERSHEVESLKQLVLQYQEQVRTLEVIILILPNTTFLFSVTCQLTKLLGFVHVLQINNYALTMHLKQAQQNNSIPGRFNPDVF